MSYIELTNLIDNILDHYNAHGKVEYNGQPIELVKEFPELDELLKDSSIKALFSTYEDKQPTWRQTVLFLSTKKGIKIMNSVFGEELMSGIMDDINESKSLKNKREVTFEDRYKL